MMFRTHSPRLACLFAIFAPVVTAAPVLETLPVVEVAVPEKDRHAILRPTFLLDSTHLAGERGGSLGSVLDGHPGVSNASYGAGVGQPLARGQSGARSQVLQNGLASQDVASFSPDHANTTDSALARSVELLQGPATLRYGSGAIGGVFNVRDNRIPEHIPERLLGGEMAYHHATASGRNEEHFALDAGPGPVVLHADGFLREWDDLAVGGNAAQGSRDPFTHGRIRNSSGRTQGGNAGFSLVGEDRFAGAAVGHTQSEYGVPGLGSAHEGEGHAPARIDLQQTRYDIAGGLTSPLRGLAGVRARLSHVDYRHDEVEGAELASSFLSEATEGRVEFEHAAMGPLGGLAGLQAGTRRLVVLGEEASLPRSDTQTQAGFWIGEANFGAWRLGGALRGERHTLRTDGHADKAYPLLSGASSLAWEPSRGQVISLSWFRSQRAPNAQELYARGVHHATQSYEEGREDLSPETSHILELKGSFNIDWARGEASVFHTWAQDYLYARDSGLWFLHDSGGGFSAQCPAGQDCLPLRRSTQQDAVFRGYEVSVSVPLWRAATNAELTLFSDAVRGRFVDGTDVPRMPPVRFGARVSGRYESWTTFISLTRGEVQDHPGQHETATPSFVALDLGVERRVSLPGGAEARLFAHARNLTDDTIRNSVSYLRAVAPEPGRGAELGVRLSF